MSKIEWLRDYRQQSGCDLNAALSAWDKMSDRLADYEKLRDAAALAAMQSILTNNALRTAFVIGSEARGVNPAKAIAHAAWEMADAFVAPRKVQDE